MRQVAMYSWIETAEARRFCMAEQALAPLRPEASTPQLSLVMKLRAMLMLRADRRCPEFASTIRATD
jgi:hypothetical protein